MSVVYLYLLVGLFVFFMNIVPVLMPPTWTVLAFFHLRFDLAILPLVVVGAIAATGGRVILAILARLYLRHVLPRDLLKNYDDLGKYFKINKKLTIPTVLLYAFSPIPSNQMFIIVGLAGLDLRVVAGAFFVGRLISYTFWVSIVHEIEDRIETLFLGHLTSTGTLLVEVAGIALIYIIGRIGWGKLLKIEERRDVL